MQYAYIFIIFITFLKDSFSGILQNKNVQTLLIGLCLYWVYQNQKEKEDSEEAKAKVFENNTNDPAGNFAILLYTAIFDISLSIPLLGKIGINTDNSKIEDIAKEMGKLKNYNEVYNAYLKIYNRNLTDDLTNEDAYQDFNKGYNSVSTVLSPSVIPKAPSTSTIKTGSNVLLKENMNLRNPDFSNPRILRVSKAEKMKVDYVFNKSLIDPISKKTIVGPWVQVRTEDVFFFDIYLVHITGIKTVGL